MDTSSEGSVPPPSDSESKSHIPRPEFTPSRKPERISKIPEKQSRQLEAIAKDPTDTQKNQLAQQLQAEDPTLPDTMVQAEVQKVFEDIQFYSEALKEAEQAVVTARKAFLGSSLNGRELNRSTYEEAKKYRVAAGEGLRDKYKQLKAAGVMVEPSQQKSDWRDKVFAGAYTLGWQAAAGEHRLGETVNSGFELVGNTRARALDVVERVGNQIAETAGNVGGQVVEVGRKGVEFGGRAIELGKQGVRGAFDKGLNSARTMYVSGKDGLIKVKDAVDSVPPAIGEAAASGVALATRVVGEVRSSAEQFLGSTWKGINVWTEKQVQWISKVAEPIAGPVIEQLQKAKESATQRIGEFVSTMERVGTSAKDVWSNRDEIVKGFVNQQRENLERLQQNTVGRVASEVSLIWEKSKVALEPHFEAFQRDREIVRAHKEMMMDKLGIVVEGVGELASPYIDYLIGKGLDIRDEAAGLGADAFRSARAVGRNGVEYIGNTPTWQFLAERFESLRLQANDSRRRLNTFLDSNLGSVGDRLKQLPASAVATAERIAALLPDVHIDGDKIMQNGREVSAEVARLFVQNASAARELLKQGGERVSQGFEAMGKFNLLYAVSKWTEAGMSKVDINRRAKLMGAIGAASLVGAGRGLRFGGAVVAEVATSPSQIAGLGALALAYYLGTNPETVSHIMSFMQSLPAEAFNHGISPTAIENIMKSVTSIQLPQIELPSPNIDIHSVVNNLGLGSHVDAISSSPAVSSVETSVRTGVDQLNSSLFLDTSHLNTAANTVSGVSSTPVSEVLPQVTSIPPTPEVSHIIGEGLNNVLNSIPAPTPTGAEQVLSSVSLPGAENVAATIASHIERGSAVIPQLQHLMPGVTGEPFMKAMNEVYLQNHQAFLDAATAMGDKDQLAAIQEIDRTPDFVSRINSPYAQELLTRAMHYWGPK